MPLNEIAQMHHQIATMHQSLMMMYDRLEGLAVRTKMLLEGDDPSDLTNDYDDEKGPPTP